MGLASRARWATHETMVVFTLRELPAVSSVNIHQETRRTENAQAVFRGRGVVNRVMENCREVKRFDDSRELTNRYMRRKAPGALR